MMERYIGFAVDPKWSMRLDGPGLRGPDLGGRSLANAEESQRR
jgi:hypothetical protein